ncbi:hypothetical protein BKI51_02420 [Alphaproteobacteria bacterium AO1-B]|nr:hypothetical protein BKI51_02420 [Alphaproteobacteria bacterium AO1-B]
MNDRGVRLVAHQYLAVARLFFVAIPNRRLKHPIAVPAACLHPVEGLLCILAALVLGDRGQDVLMELTISIIAQLNRW